MADKLSKGSNSCTFKNVSVDIGVIGYGNTKTVILTKTKTKEKKKKKKKKKNTHYQITFEKEKFYVNSTDMCMAFACLLK